MTRAEMYLSDFREGQESRCDIGEGVIAITEVVDKGRSVGDIDGLVACPED